MNLEDNQEKIYNDYWEGVEETFANNERDNKQVKSGTLDEFINFFLVASDKKKDDLINKKEIYNEFKVWYESQNKKFKPLQRVETFLKNFIKYLDYYKKMRFEEEENPELRTSFEYFNKLNVFVIYPFLLKVYNEYDEKKIKKIDFLNIINFIQSYVFRLKICGVPTNDLKSIFSDMYDKLKDTQSWKEGTDLYDRLCASLIDFEIIGPKNRFPNDEFFKDGLESKPISHSINLFSYLLSKIERHKHPKEIVDDERQSVEHIMPQTMTDEWWEEVGMKGSTKEKKEEYKEKYLQHLGNLSLTHDNSNLSNKPIKEKLKYYKESKLWLAKTIIETYDNKGKKWGEAAIKKRAQILTSTALKVWKYPSVKIDTNPKDLASYFKDGQKVRNLYLKLEAKVKKIDNLQERIWVSCAKNYIAFKVASRVIVYLFTAKTKMTLKLQMSLDDLDDPKGICRRQSEASPYGKTEVFLSKDEEFEDVFYIA